MKRSVIAALLLLAACAGDRRSGVDQKIIGQWNVERVYQGGEDVTPSGDDDRWIEFDAKGGFVSDGNRGPITRQWAYNREHDVVCISGGEEGQRAECWDVTVEGDVMRWTNVASGQADSPVVMVMFSAR